MSEDEQLARALAASRLTAEREQGRLRARTDEEEQEAMSVAIALSLSEYEEQLQRTGGADPQANPPPARPHQGHQQPQAYPPPAVYGGYQPPPVYPPVPQPALQQQQQQQRQQQQQHYPSPAAPTQQHKQPSPWQPPPQPAQPNGRAATGSNSGIGNTAQGSSSSSGAGRDRWSKPLGMIDAAFQKVMDGLGASCCGGCGRALGVGPTLRALGQEWHPSCFRCAGCQRPMDIGGHNMTFSVGEDGQPYHADCHRQRFHPKCDVCGDFLPARADGRIEWRSNPFWKDKHCPSHSVDGTLQCCSCNKLQPVGEEWVSLQDGRQLCLECLDTLVVDTKDAQPLYDEVLQFFSYMGMPHPYKAPLLLVEGPVLEEYADREGRPKQPGASGPVFHIRGLCVAHVYTTIPSVVRAWGGHAAINSISTAVAPLMQQAQQHCTVSVLLVMYGLPRLLIGSIVAHELMHAYLRMRNVAGLPLQVEEGLCQLMAMLWLDSQDHWAKRHSNPYQEKLLSYLGFQIRSDTSDVYGEGFRIALEKFQQRGLKALVEHVIQHHSWPDWAG